MNMATFSNPVIQYMNSQNIKVAGIDGKWNRPIIISDSGDAEKISIPSVGAIFPSGAPSTERDDIKCLLGLKGVKVSCFIESAIGVAEYYKRQKVINTQDKELIIVDVDQHFTDLCHVKYEADGYLIKNRLRVDYGVDFVADRLVELPRYKNLSDALEELSDVIQTEILRSQLPREKSNDEHKTTCHHAKTTGYCQLYSKVSDYHYGKY